MVMVDLAFELQTWEHCVQLLVTPLQECSGGFEEGEEVVCQNAAWAGGYLL